MNLLPAIERLDLLCDSLARFASAGRAQAWPLPLVGAATRLGAALEEIAGSLDGAADWPQARALFAQAQKTLPDAFAEFGRAVAENLAAGTKLRDGGRRRRSE